MQELAAINETIIAQIDFFCLTPLSIVFQKGYEKMNHLIYLLNQKIYTVRLIDTTFSKQNQEKVPIYLQSEDFSAKQEDMSVSQRLLLLEESSLYFPLRRALWGFLVILPSPSRQRLLGKKWYQFQLWRKRLPPSKWSLSE